MIFMNAKFFKFTVKQQILGILILMESPKNDGRTIGKNLGLEKFVKPNIHVGVVFADNPDYFFSATFFSGD